MPIVLIAGPAVALIGVIAVFFVLRRKSVDKRSMYSARRSQIEHKVRAARQRTLAPHGHAEKPGEPAPAEAPSPFAEPLGGQATSYAPAAYEPPPAALTPPAGAPEAPPSESPWGPPAPGPSPFGVPPSEPPPFQPAPEPFQPAPEPAPYQPAAAEPVWTPAPAPSEPATPIEPAQPAVTTPAGASWSIVGDSKDMSGGAEPDTTRKKGKQGAPSGSWQLASGEAPGAEGDEIVKAPSATVAVAQYAILVVGLVMVLIGVLVMIANSHTG
jgi:hypothetical protein